LLCCFPRCLVACDSDDDGKGAAPAETRQRLVHVSHPEKCGELEGLVLVTAAIFHHSTPLALEVLKQRHYPLSDLYPELSWVMPSDASPGAGAGAGGGGGGGGGGLVMGTLAVAVAVPPPSDDVAVDVAPASAPAATAAPSAPAFGTEADFAAQFPSAPRGVVVAAPAAPEATRVPVAIALPR
jgi:hypothetical protein